MNHRWHDDVVYYGILQMFLFQDWPTNSKKKSQKGYLQDVIGVGTKHHPAAVLRSGSVMERLCHTPSLYVLPVGKAQLPQKHGWHWHVMVSTWVLYGFWMSLDDVHMQFPRHLQNNSSFTDAFLSAVAQITLRPMPSHSGARKPRRSAEDLRRSEANHWWSLRNPPGKNMSDLVRFFFRDSEIPRKWSTTFEALLQDVSWIAPIPAMFHQAPWWMLQFLDFVALASHQRCVLQWNLEKKTFCLGKNWGRSWWQVTGKGNASTDGAATRATWKSQIHSCLQHGFWIAICHLKQCHQFSVELMPSIFDCWWNFRTNIPMFLGFRTKCRFFTCYLHLSLGFLGSVISSQAPRRDRHCHLGLHFVGELRVNPGCGMAVGWLWDRFTMDSLKWCS